MISGARTEGARSRFNLGALIGGFLHYSLMKVLIQCAVAAEYNV